MRIPSSVKRNLAGCAMAAASLFFAVSAHASTFRVLYSFKGEGDGGQPTSPLVVDADGNLYGTTDLLNGYTDGVVFRLAPGGDFKVLATFYDNGGAVGYEPVGLVRDQNGNLWGTTSNGGSGGGAVFEITSRDKEKLIHTFQGSPSDGCDVFAPLVQNSKDQYFGTSTGCGKHGLGAIVRLAPNGNVSLLHSFSDGLGGNMPFASVTMDGNGNLYGTNVWGPPRWNAGTVFELSREGRDTLLYTFHGSPKDGANPTGGVIMDPAGSLYGTTYVGGRPGCWADAGCGIVFKLTRDAGEMVLHFFKGGGEDGANPFGGVLADGAGNLYGVTEFGGGATPCNGAIGCGTVFEIAADGTETILHKFDEARDGANSYAGLAAGAVGNFYGTTQFGGAYGYGTVFEITP